MIPSDLGLPAKFGSFRSHPGFNQLDTAISLASSHCRFSLEQIPPGGGKSIINMAVAKLIGARVLYLVATKNLESQLLDDFSSCGLVGIRGHSNYPCADTLFDDSGELLDLECTGNCLYRADVDRCLGSSAVVTNIAHWVQLAKSDDPTRLGTFDLMIIDEAQSVPDIMTGLLSIKISPKTIRASLSLDTPALSSSLSTWISWASEAVQVARRKYSDVKAVSSNKDRSSSNKELAKLTRLGKDLSTISNIGRRNSNGTSVGISSTPQWVVQPEERRGKRLAVFSPVWPSTFCEQYLFRSCPRIILSSATVPPQIKRYLGIKDSESDYHEIQSGFDVRRRPFIYIPTTPVDYKMIEGQRIKWVRTMDRIIEGRLDRKGVIHTRSYDRAKEIMRRSKFCDLMLTHNSGNSRDTIEQFKQASAPCVLVSPSVEEGVDFPYDQCNYQIIAKVPLIDRRSPIMKARCLEDKTYPIFVAAQDLVQMSGRGMRSDNDFCETWIVDDNWKWFRDKAKFPKWFRDSFRQVDRILDASTLER